MPIVSTSGYQALLFVSFGGPEGPNDVIPFLENVLRGKNVPRERLEEVAQHYDLFGGVSPINGQNRAVIDALKAELKSADIDLPVYWGNRNWDPYLKDTLDQMRKDGVQKAMGFFTSAFSSYSGCRQYREDIQRALSELGAQTPAVDRLRVFYDHPLFIQVNAENLTRALADVPSERRAKTPVVFTAHSIPLTMAKGSQYVEQLRQAGRRVTDASGVKDFSLVYQSRSGSPRQPWLEPDILATLREFASAGTKDVVVLPLGFVSDHMEVLYDLDTEARALAQELGLNLVRAQTVGTHPLYIRMIRELIEDGLKGSGVAHEYCHKDCCLLGSEGRPA